MMASGFKLLCLAIALHMSSIGLCADEKYYRAAVHEICQYNEDSSSDSEILSQNMAKYIQAAEISAFEDVDILVYAEKGLFPLRPSNATWFLSYAEDVPSGKERANPCDQEEYSDRPILITLSCIAKVYRLTIVADLIDKKKCIVSEDCDRTTINYCVSNADECPEDASNVHQPNVGSLGSGIYIPGKGALIYSYNPDGRSKLLISNVPKSNNLTGNEFLNTKFYYIDDNDTFTELYGEEPRYFGRECSVDVLGEEVSSFTDYRCRQTEVDQYTFTRLNDTSGQIDTCSNGFCCSLSYASESMNEAFYFGVSGYRLKFYETFWFGVQACFLARCEDVDGKPCRNFLLKSDTIFQNVEITGSFETKHIYPHAMDTELRLTNRSEWHSDGVSMSYESVNQNPLLFMGLYGRVYRRDGLVKQ
ncbi:vascular non-inflammatory molecule 2 [Caerostris extrusa]|uniref:Vascular non-inflammatory molecule 2 n=1 Tax=Caerostris extrusa TaxID=172846 RepID=A0AAV4NZ59_CAEEX|nr:vascular non-inflammatory molecule 2 [Caerostris extrusa]